MNPVTVPTHLPSSPRPPWVKPFLLILAAASVALGAADGPAPTEEFARIAAMAAKDAPSQDLVERLYEFMEKYPKDPRSDQVQFWVASTQQKRKFHNDAIKEFGFVISDFPASPLVIPALRAQVDSYLAIEKPDKAADNYAKILAARPADFAASPTVTAAYRDAVLFTADRHVARKEHDAAIKLLLQLPSRSEGITRVVQLYIAADRHDEALAMIRRLPKEDKPLAYRLTLAAYADRPGVTNLFALLDQILASEPAGAATDQLIQQVVTVISAKGNEHRDKVLNHVAEKYDRLRRPCHLALCQLHKDDHARLIRFIGDYRTGPDVEKVKVMVGELHETRGDAAKAREAYWLLDDKPAAHFLVARTWYGKLARKKDLPTGQKELTQIVKRFYSPAVSAEALLERAELEAGPMGTPAVAIATLRELLDRFPREGHWPIRATFYLGTLLRQERKVDEAIVLYERFIRDYADSGTVVRRAWLELAACHEEKRDTQRAIALYRMVIRKFPHSTEASRAHTTLEQRYNVPDVDVSDRSN